MAAAFLALAALVSAAGAAQPQPGTTELDLRQPAPAATPIAAASTNWTRPPRRSRYSITIPLDPATQGAPPPRVEGPAGRPLVVIDAGHGGHDPGTISEHDGTREKNVTLAVARRIRDALLASGRVRVALTRDDDHFLILRERTAIARSLGVGLFISIHADSAGETAFARNRRRNCVGTRKSAFASCERTVAARSPGSNGGALMMTVPPLKSTDNVKVRPPPK